MNHPVRFDVSFPAGPRDRLRALVRPVLIVPHLLLVGGPVMGRTGVLGAVAFLCALFDWVTIVVTGKPVAGLEFWKRAYLQWRARVAVYGAFLRDEYPPFDDAPYPIALQLPHPPAVRDRVNVLLRPIYALPHVVVLALLSLAFAAVTLVAWLFLAITGEVPLALLRFSRGVVGYGLRLEAYVLLMHDQFPPFALDVDAREMPTVPDFHAPAGARP